MGGKKKYIEMFGSFTEPFIYGCYCMHVTHTCYHNYYVICLFNYMLPRQRCTLQIWTFILPL